MWDGAQGSCEACMPGMWQDVIVTQPEVARSREGDA